MIVASEDAIKRLGIDPSRAIRVTASAASSEGAGAHATADAAITKDTIADALKQASLAPTNVDVLELHDAFTVEELHYVEAMGVCKPGQAIHLLKEGAFDIGGQMAVSPSGGLIAMGHPHRPDRRRSDRRDHHAASRRSRRSPAQGREGRPRPHGRPGGGLLRARPATALDSKQEREGPACCTTSG